MVREGGGFEVVQDGVLCVRRENVACMYVCRLEVKGRS